MVSTLLITSQGSKGVKVLPSPSNFATTGIRAALDQVFTLSVWFVLIVPRMFTHACKEQRACLFLLSEHFAARCCSSTVATLIFKVAAQSTMSKGLKQSTTNWAAAPQCNKRKLMGVVVWEVWGSIARGGWVFVAVSLEWFKDCWSIKTFRGFRWLAFLLWAGLGFVFQEKRGSGLKGLGVLLGSCGPWLSFRSKGFDFFVLFAGVWGFLSV